MLNYNFRSLYYTKFSRGGDKCLSVDKELFIEKLRYLSQYVNNTQLPSRYITCRHIAGTYCCLLHFLLALFFVIFFANFKLIRIVLKETLLFRK